MNSKKGAPNRGKTPKKRPKEKVGAQSYKKTSRGLQRLVHDLEIHQVELNLQNEELRKAQVELAASRDRYTDLYEFAPIAYVTLDKQGRILESNLMAARLLGVERRSLLRANLTKFVSSESQDDW